MMGIKTVLSGLLVLGLCTTAWSNPLNVELGNPAPPIGFIGIPSTLSIHVEPTYNPSTVTGLTARFSPLGRLRGFALKSHTCPGVMTEATDGTGADIIEWTGMGNLANSDEINCELELYPVTTYAKVQLAFDCQGCGANPASNASTVELRAEEPPDLSARININEHPSVGPMTFNVLIDNIGTGPARNVSVAVYGDSAIFATMDPVGIGPNCGPPQQDFESVTWEITQINAGATTINCAFEFDVPGTGEYDLTLSVLGESLSGKADPYPGNNAQTVTLRPTNLVVNSRFSFYADANPGDGICADSNNGACSLRAAVDESNALLGFQTIQVPYEFGGYYLGGLTGPLTITDPVLIVGVPDPATGNYPWITRSDGEDTNLIKVDTNSETRTELKYLDLRGQDKLVTVDGAVIRQFSGALWVTESKISGGRTTGAGGAIRGSVGLRLAGVEFFDNQAGTGGAIAVYSLLDDIPDARLIGNSFHDNIATDAGGAAYFIGAIVDIEQSSFVHNHANKGGALFMSTRAEVNILNTTISENTADSQGGGIYDLEGRTILSFVTLVYNEAGPGDLTVGEGGGIYVDNAFVAPRVGDSIIVYNTAQSTNPGGFGFNKGGNCFGTLDAYQTSLNGISVDPDCSVVGIGSTLTAAPGLTDLITDESGLSYHLLRRVNTEVDQAAPSCLSIEGSVFRDQRGRPRPMQGDGVGEALCDRGAIEMYPVRLTIEVNETGPAAWQIDLEEPYAACTTSPCKYYFLPVGAEVTLTAEPEPGTQFEGWGGTCAAAGNNLTCIAKLSETSGPVTAQFSSAAVARALTVEVTGPGNVSSIPGGINCPHECQSDFADGSSVTLTATPYTGKVFAGWSGACNGTGSCEVTMNAAKTVNALFEHTSEMIFESGFE